MFEHLNNPEEIFSFKLGAALKMENELVDTLEELAQSAHRERSSARSPSTAKRRKRTSRTSKSAFACLGRKSTTLPARRSRRWPRRRRRP